jgi:hypothetical protein
MNISTLSPRFPFREALFSLSGTSDAQAAYTVLRTQTQPGGDEMDNNNISMAQAMAFANSPTGQQLIRILQQKNDPKLTQAAQAAASGNTDQAKDSIASLLRDPQIQALLKQFGG